MGVHAREGRKVDNVTTAALLQQRNRFVTTVEDAAEIGFDHRAKFVSTRGFHRGKDPDAGVVYENVETTERINGFLEKRFDLRFVANVTNKTETPAGANLVQISSSSFDVVFVARAYRNVDTGANECFGNRAADALRTASHNSFFT
jgi:hypothetical protein